MEAQEAQACLEIRASAGVANTMTKVRVARTVKDASLTLACTRDAIAVFSLNSCTKYGTCNARATSCQCGIDFTRHQLGSDSL